MFYLTKNQFFNYLWPIANIKFYCLKSVTIKDLLSYKSVLNTITRTNPSRSICGVHYMTRESIFLNQHGSQPTATNIFFLHNPTKSYFKVCLMMMMMMMMNYFCSIVDRGKAFSLISIENYYQRSSSSRISDTLRGGFEPAQSLSSGLVEWSCAVVINTTPWRHNSNIHH